MPDDWDLRREIILACRMMYQQRLVTASDGNVSARLPDGNLLITPSGVSKGFVTEDQLLVIDRGGRKIEGGEGLRPSSEIQLHLTCYDRRDDIASVMHAHPPTAVAFSIAGISLAQCILPEVILSFGSIPTATYGTPTTRDLPDSISGTIETNDAIILERHGSVTVGTSVLDAFFKLEKLEHAAEITYRARMLGRVTPLPEGEVDRLLAIRRRAGFKGRATVCNECGICSDAVEHADPAAQRPTAAHAPPPDPSVRKGEARRPPGETSARP